MAGRMDFTLTPADRESPLWKQLHATVAARLEEYRNQLEQVKLTDAETASLRGKISFAREFLSLADKRASDDVHARKAVRFTPDE